MTKKLFFLAGEQSGDLHGAALAAAIKKSYADVAITGVAGDAMKKEGITALIESKELAVMGVSDVVKALPRLYKSYCHISHTIIKEAPEAVVLIDYQDFNMRLGRRLRKKGYKGKIIHYISPSVWAWRSKRAEVIGSYADLLLTIYPFEKRCYNGLPLNVLYIGNPIVDSALSYCHEGTFRERFGIDKETELLTLFPGSRKGEVAANLPLQLQAAKELKKRRENLHICLSVANKQVEGVIQHQLSQSPLKPQLIPQEEKYPLMYESQAAIATSGTVTLELALLCCPSVITYKMGSLNRFLAKHLFEINLPHYCIVNIIAERELFPEWIKNEADSCALARDVESLLPKGSKRLECLQGCQQIAKMLETAKSPAEYAAGAIMELLQ